MSDRSRARQHRSRCVLSSGRYLCPPHPKMGTPARGRNLGEHCVPPPTPALRSPCGPLRVGWRSGWQWETWWRADGCREELGSGEDCTYAGISLVRWLENKETRTLRRDGQTERLTNNSATQTPSPGRVFGESEGVRGRRTKLYPRPCPSAVELGISRGRVPSQAAVHRESPVGEIPSPEAEEDLRQQLCTRSAYLQREAPGTSTATETTGSERAPLAHGVRVEQMLETASQVPQRRQPVPAGRADPCCTTSRGDEGAGRQA